MKKTLPLIIGLLFVLNIQAQQDIQISQYMFNKLLYNPGYAGSNGHLCGSLLYRKQWVGFGGEPTTITAAGDYLLFGKHGLGLKVIKDDIGATSNLAIALSYAYQYPLTIPGIGTGRLGLGIELGVLQRSVSTNWIARDDFTTDNAIPNSSVGGLNFDMGLGIYYNIPNKLYFGLSSSHLLEPNSIKESTNQSQLSISHNRHYYINGGYFWDIQQNKKFVIEPSTLIKATSATVTFDFSALLHYNQKFHGGIAYRLQDAFSVIAGLRIKEYLFVSAAYDITTSSLNSVSNGSPEIMLKYCREIEKKTKQSSYKSVLFL